MELLLHGVTATPLITPAVMTVYLRLQGTSSSRVERADDLGDGGVGGVDRPLIESGPSVADLNEWRGVDAWVWEEVWMINYPGPQGKASAVITVSFAER